MLKYIKDICQVSTPNGNICACGDKIQVLYNKNDGKDLFDIDEGLKYLLKRGPLTLIVLGHIPVETLQSG